MWFFNFQKESDNANKNFYKSHTYFFHKYQLARDEHMKIAFLRLCSSNQLFLQFIYKPIITNYLFP